MKTQPVKIAASILEGMGWVKSSFSNNGGNCIEVCHGIPGVVPVRDSKNPQGPILITSEAAWGAFVKHVKH